MPVPKIALNMENSTFLFDEGVIRWVSSQKTPVQFLVPPVIDFAVNL